MTTSKPSSTVARISTIGYVPEIRKERQPVNKHDSPVFNLEAGTPDKVLKQYQVP